MYERIHWNQYNTSKLTFLKHVLIFFILLLYTPAKYNIFTHTHAHIPARARTHMHTNAYTHTETGWLTLWQRHCDRDRMTVTGVIEISRWRQGDSDWVIETRCYRTNMNRHVNYWHNYMWRCSLLAAILLIGQYIASRNHYVSYLVYDYWLDLFKIQWMCASVEHL